MFQVGVIGVQKRNTLRQLVVKTAGCRVERSEKGQEEGCAVV